MKLNTVKEIESYFQGVKAGMKMFMNGRDGTKQLSYLGETYEQACRRVESQRQEVLRNFSGGKEIWIS